MLSKIVSRDCTKQSYLIDEPFYTYLWISKSQAKIFCAKIVDLFAVHMTAFCLREV